MNQTARVQTLDEHSEIDEHDRRSGAVNATCECFLGSVRRECLDHVIILGEDLRREDEITATAAPQSDSLLPEHRDHRHHGVRRDLAGAG
ncbi:MAG: hypothetical protein JW751_18945 [Polyangiaceae bacterium]|nr:hypothetical protein [Polyangiaceae bacterium]